MIAIPALWDKLAGSVPLLVFIAVVTAFIVYHRQIGAILGMVTNVKFRDFSAEFDRAAVNAFDSAAQKVWSVSQKSCPSMVRRISRRKSSSDTPAKRSLSRRCRPIIVRGAGFLSYPSESRRRNRATAGALWGAPSPS